MLTKQLIVEEEKMKKLSLVITVLMLTIAIVLSGCAPAAQEVATTEGNATEQSDAAPAPAAEGEEAQTTKTVDTDLANMTWDEVLAEANGQTVNWYAWGGSQTTNNFVQTVVAERAAEYGVTLNWVTVGNITDAINITMAEKQAGVQTGGEVDMFWINGGNFYTSQQAGILFGPWAESIDNAQYVDWDSTTINTDLGFPVDGMESPWASTVRMQIYDTERLSEDELPMNLDELVEWIKANPGKYTYCPPPVFFGTRLIKEWIYETVGEETLGWTADNITQEEFYEATKEVWDMMEEIRPYLWREGESFPKDATELDRLFSDGEVDFTYAFLGTGIEGKVNEGLYPTTAKPYLMDVSVGDTNYVAITYNSDNKAGAMVIANIIQDPEVQALAARDISFGPVVATDTLGSEEKATFDEIISEIDPNYYISSEDIAESKSPEFSGTLNGYIENIWTDLFLN